MYCQDAKAGHQRGYPCLGLVTAALQGIQDEARRRFPSRFQQKPFDVMHARPLNDPEAWKQVLGEIEQRFSNTHKKPFNLNPGDPLREVQDRASAGRLDTSIQALAPGHTFYAPRGCADAHHRRGGDGIGGPLPGDLPETAFRQTGQGRHLLLWRPQPSSRGTRSSSRRAAWTIEHATSARFRHRALVRGSTRNCSTAWPASM